MDKQRVKGAYDEAAGGVKRQVGKWTGDTGTEVAGAVQQIKGKVETAVGKLKDAAREAHDNAVTKQQSDAEVARPQPEVVITGDRTKP